MADRVVIPLPGLGVLLLDRDVFEAALQAGATLTTAPAATTDEPLVTAEQLSAVLGVPVTWIEQAAREERIPSLQFGRWRRFRRSEVEAAVASINEEKRA